jgi:hypothetical protein
MRRAVSWARWRSSSAHTTVAPSRVYDTTLAWPLPHPSPTGRPHDHDDLPVEAVAPLLAHGLTSPAVGALDVIRRPGASQREAHQLIARRLQFDEGGAQQRGDVVLGAGPGEVVLLDGVAVEVVELVGADAGA